MAGAQPRYDAAAVVLEVLAGRRLTGYEIARACQGRVIGQSTSWLYPALYTLEAQGAIAAHWTRTNGTLRRRYSLLGAGRSPFSVWQAPAGRAKLPAEPAPPDTAANRRAAAYLGQVAESITLPPGEVAEIRRELENHLEDAGVIERSAFDPHVADAFSAAVGPADVASTDRTAEPARLLGVPEQLGNAIAAARRNRADLERIVKTTLLIAPFLLLFSAAATAAVMTALRGLVDLALRFTGGGFVAASLALNQRQLVFPIVVGAFLAGRFVAGRIFAVGHRFGSLVVGLLTVAAVFLLGIPALTIEFNLDPVTGAVLVGIPLALVLGVLRPIRFEQRLISVRGIASAVVLGLLALSLPLDGPVAFVPPDPVLHDASVRQTVEPPTDFERSGWDGEVYFENPPDWKQVCTEAAPAVIEGWRASIDPAARLSPLCVPVVSDPPYVNWTLPGPLGASGAGGGGAGTGASAGGSSGRSWIGLVWLEDASGQRHTLTATVVVATPYHGSILSWLSRKP